MLEWGSAIRSSLALWCCAVGSLLAVSPGLAAPGSLDQSFGQAGEFVLQANPACHPVCVEFAGSYGTALTFQRGRKIVLGGYNDYLGAGPRIERPATALLRLNPDGTLDPTFGREGLTEGPSFGISSIHQSADGRLLAVGRSEAGAQAEEYTEAGLSTGSFDLGATFPTVYTHVFDVKVDAAGRILVLLASPTGGLEVRRFLAHGVPDPSFGVGGTVQLRGAPATETSPPAVLGEQRDGKIVVVASIELSSQPTTRKLFFARLTPRGKLDRSFDSGRTAPLPLYGRYETRTLAVGRDGSVLIAAGEDTTEPIREEHLLLFRYTPAGQLDKSFGHNGVADRIVFRGEQGGGRFGRIEPSAIAFDGRGNAIVAGSNDIMTIDAGSAGSWFLSRFTRHGLDCSFGDRGFVLGDARGSASAVAIQPDGRIVLVGDRDHQFMAARYIGGGTPRTCPGEGKKRPPKHGRRHKRSRRR